MSCRTLQRLQRHASAPCFGRWSLVSDRSLRPVQWTVCEQPRHRQTPLVSVVLYIFVSVRVVPSWRRACRALRLHLGAHFLW